jgi:FKBP-type peptidyl-prolyl cis-trans isomerase (trigger factor)
MADGLANVKISRDESAWEFEVRAEIPAATLAQHRDATLKELQKTAKLDGFRPGNAPIERIVQVYGEDAIEKRVVEHAIQHELPELLAKEKALIVESPRVSIEQAEKGKGVRFTARAALAPSIELPDYRAIAREKNAQKEEVSVSDEEHAQAMTHLRRERARVGKIEAGMEPQKAHEESKAMKEEELPALDDAFVQSLGLENAEKFSEAVRANIKTEKELQAREKQRAGLLEELVKRSTIKYPAMLREYELDDMEARMKADLERMGTTIDAYLTQAKKSREQVRAEWKDAADKRAKVRLVLAEIARKENVEPDKERLEKELEHARKHVPNADPEALKAHIAHALRNEATLEFLEKQK